jgi:hypothetical protein
VEAYFVFQQTSPAGDLKKFVFQLTDETKIKLARSILSDPNSARRHVQGTIIPKPATYNPEWSFHLDPSSIGFFEMQIEVCDANVTYVQDHLDEIGGSTLPNSFWCPWSSELIAELTEPSNDGRKRQE